MGSHDIERLPLGSLLAAGDDEILRALVHRIRCSGIKFGSRAVFDRTGWSGGPIPRIEKFYRVRSGEVVPHPAPYIWDLRETLMRDDALLLAAMLMHRRVQLDTATYVVGLETAAIPLLGSLMTLNGMVSESRPIACGYLRKERKRDGLRRLLEGARIPRGSRVVVVDDVYNRGIRKRKIVDYCDANGLQIARFLVVVDTESTAGRAFKALHPVEALVTKSNIFGAAFTRHSP